MCNKWTQKAWSGVGSSLYVYLSWKTQTHKENFGTNHENVMTKTNYELCPLISVVNTDFCIRQSEKLPALRHSDS